MQAWYNGFPPGADGQIKIGGFRNELFGQVNHRAVGHMNLKMPKERSGQPLVHQDASMLRVIDEFDHIESAVAPFNQMRLCAAAHFPD